MKKMLGIATIAVALVGCGADNSVSATDVKRICYDTRIGVGDIGKRQYMQYADAWREAACLERYYLNNDCTHYNDTLMITVRECLENVSME